MVDIPENIYGHRKRLDWIAKQVKGKSKMLDIGCGTGVMVTIPLATPGYCILGIDLDKASIDLANSLNSYPNAEFKHCDARELSDRYDVIILSEVLEHLRDPRGLLQVCHGLLSKKGTLVVTVPNGYGWFELEQLLWGKLKLGWLLEKLKLFWLIDSIKDGLLGEYVCSIPSSLSSSPHIQRFTLGSIKNMLTRRGFLVIETEGSTLIAGKFSNHFLTGFAVPMRINNWLGSILKPVASGFYIMAKRRGS